LKGSVNFTKNPQSPSAPHENQKILRAHATDLVVV